MKKALIPSLIFLGVATWGLWAESKPSIPTVLVGAGISQDEQLKTAKENIVGFVETPTLEKDGKIFKEKKPGGVIFYAYKTKKIATEKDEVIEKRTAFSKTFKTDSPNEFVLKTYATYPQFFQDANGEWWQTEYATTTKTAFDAQTAFHHRLKQKIFAYLFMDNYFPNNRLLLAMNGLDVSLGGFFLARTVYADTFVQYSKSNIYRGAVSESWATIRAGAGSGTYDPASGACDSGIQAYGQTGPSAYKYLNRTIFLFDTSTIGSGATVNSATVSLYAQCKGGGDNTETATIYSSNPASESSIVASDFSNTGTTAYSDTEPTAVGLSTTAYTDFPFNATGIANVSVTGRTKLSLKYTKDSSGTDPSWPLNGEGPYFIFYSSEYTGTDKDPVLTVSYTAGGGGSTTTDIIFFTE